MSSKSGRVKERMLGLGESRSMAERHISGACIGCRCASCKIQPCWICTPICTKREKGPHGNAKCQFDDLVPGGKLCTYCGGMWPPKVDLMSHPMVKFIVTDIHTGLQAPLSDFKEPS